MKAKIRIRFKCLGNSHSLGKAMHTREKRNIRPRETTPIRDAESGRNPSLFLERGRLGKRRKSAALEVNLKSLAGE